VLVAVVVMSRRQLSLFDHFVFYSYMNHLNNVLVWSVLVDKLGCLK